MNCPDTGQGFEQLDVKGVPENSARFWIFLVMVVSETILDLVSWNSQGEPVNSNVCFFRLRQILTENSVTDELESVSRHPSGETVE